MEGASEWSESNEAWGEVRWKPMRSAGQRGREGVERVSERVSERGVNTSLAQ